MLSGGGGLATGAQRRLLCVLKTGGLVIERILCQMLREAPQRRDNERRIIPRSLALPFVPRPMPRRTSAKPTGAPGCTCITRRVSPSHGAVETCRGAAVAGVVLCIMVVSLSLHPSPEVGAILPQPPGGSHYAAKSAANAGGAGMKAGVRVVQSTLCDGAVGRPARAGSSTRQISAPVRREYTS